MKYIAAFLLLVAGVVSPAAFSQAGASAAPASAAACPTTKTLDELVKALDAALSVPGDSDRTCLRDLFLPDARLWPVVKQPDGSFAPHPLSVEDFIAGSRRRGNAIVYETQVKVIPQVYGHIAHLWATYEVRRDSPASKPVARGINSFYAVNDGTRWRFQAIEWEAETPATPLPEKYLP